MIKFGVLFILFGVSATLADSFPYHESFESGSGRWFSGGGDFSWTWKYGPTGSWYTGPNGAHDRTYYMYTEASGYPDKTAILEAEFDVSSLANPMMSFRYHMYGASMGTLKVQVFTGGEWVTDVNSIHIGEEQDDHDDPWRRQEIDLLTFAGETNLKIRFWVKTGSTWTSDVCIDDVWLYDKVDETLDHFVWSAIGDPQTKGASFPVQVEAVNSSGTRLTSFNEAVELTAWSEGFTDPIENGDFEEYWDADWSQINPTPETSMQWKDSIFGSGKALAFKPSTIEDGLQQEVTLVGGETYLVFARAALDNSGGSDIDSTVTCSIKINGIVRDSATSTYLYGSSSRSFFLYDYFVPPTDGTYTVQLSATSSGGLSDIFAYFDDVSVNFAPPQFLTTDPGMSGTFSNGVWNGTMVLDHRLPANKLIARYVDVIGMSNPFSTYTSPSDRDGDGLLDSWETTYFDTVADCNPSVDFDGDGYSNADEYFLGTIPTDNTSSLALSTVITGNNECILTWYSSVGLTYDVEWTPTLIPLQFSSLAGALPFPRASYTNDTSGSEIKGFYRLKVRKP